MSTQFGVPPPPRPQVYEPGSGAAAAQRAEWLAAQPVVRPRERDPWKRRLAVLLTFVAVSLVVLANFAAWMNFTAFSAATAKGAVAAATFDDVAAAVAPQLADTVNAVALDRARATSYANPVTGAVTGTVEETIRRDVDAAVDAAVQSPTFRAAWADALATAAERQRALGQGTAGTPLGSDGTLVVLATDSLTQPINDSLVADGYTFMAGTRYGALTFSVGTTDTAADYRDVIALTSLWWLLLLGAIAAGAGAIRIASRRFRLAIIMAIDVAVVLALSIVLVPLIGQVVDDQAVDPGQQTLIVDAYTALSRTLITQTTVLVVIALCTALVLAVVARSRRRGDPPPTAA